MRIKLKEGAKTFEEMFGVKGERAEELFAYVMELIKEGNVKKAIPKMFKKANTSKELAYLIIYYLSFSHAINFDMYLDDVMKKALKEEENSHSSDIYR